MYRVVRPPVRLMRRFVAGVLSRPSYWDQRRDYKYYKEAIRLARTYAPTGRRALDVGSFKTEVLDQLDWFERRLALDMRYILPRKGVETLVMNFMDFQPESCFDLVLCLQVLEHLKEPAPFARKLLETGRSVIISVPYKWPHGLNKMHPQDPIDEAKLESWTQRKPVETVIVEDNG